MVMAFQPISIGWFSYLVKAADKKVRLTREEINGSFWKQNNSYDLIAMRNDSRIYVQGTHLSGEETESETRGAESK